MDQKEKIERVDEVIKGLGLAHVSKSRIGDSLHRGISGGERKRVSIGIEFM